VQEQTLPDELVVTAHSASGVVMAARHRDVAVEGVQFHPESVLTQAGHRMLANWLADCGDDEAPRRANGLQPVLQRGPSSLPLPDPVG
jgi:para-aminobenzoate synthetase component 2